MNTQTTLQLGPPEPAARIYVAGNSLTYVWPAQSGFLWFAVANVDEGEIIEARRPVSEDWLNVALNVAGFDMGQLRGHYELSRPEWRETAMDMGFAK